MTVGQVSCSINSHGMRNYRLPLVQTISTLFQFFLDQNLIQRETFLQWNTHGHSYDLIYHDETKRFAQSFFHTL